LCLPFRADGEGGAGGGRESCEDFGPSGGELGDDSGLGALLIVRERREIEGERLFCERFGALPLLRDGHHDGPTEELQERFGGRQAGLARGDADAGGETIENAGHRGRELTYFVEGKHPGVARQV